MDYPMEEIEHQEDYFLLRLPKVEAEIIRRILHKKPKKMPKRLSIEFDDQMENGLVYIKDNDPLSAKMVHLPAIIEVNKITNGVNMFKTGTISQMLVAGENPALERVRNDNWPHGISLPLKNVRKQRFRKTMRNHENSKESSSVQKEVSWLLRSDSQAISSRFEISYETGESQYDDDDDDGNYSDEITAEDLFGDLSDSDTSSSGSVAHDIIEF